MISIADPADPRVPLQSEPLHGVPLLARKPCPLSSSLTLHPSRRAFTLTELLVVITIIGMLASMALGALYSARESARVAKTQATITKLDRVIQARYTEFFTRRVPIPNRRISPDAMAELKLRVLHEIMRMEMPQRASDIVFPRHGTSTDVADAIPADIAATVKPLATFATSARSIRNFVDISGKSFPAEPPPVDVAGFERTALAKRYFRHVVGTSFLTSLKYDSAECLYMIVNTDPEAREQFQATEIGDADADGFFEFHDAWGMPIMFLRWAPGFVGESELMTAIDDDNDSSTPLVGDGENDPDPMNPRRIGDLYLDSGKWVRPGNTVAFRLVPLIYSGGPDQKYGINQKSGWIVQYGSGSTTAPQYDNESVNKIWLDGSDIGMPVDASDPEYDSHNDNITNHSLGMN